jgi:hypothetical protein
VVGVGQTKTIAFIFCAVLFVGVLKADGVSGTAEMMPSRQAITFEPLVLGFNGTQDVGPLSYHYSLNRFISLSGLAQLAAVHTDTYSSFRFGLGLGLDLWLFSSGPFQGLFWGHRFDADNTWVVVPATYSGNAPGPGFSLAQADEAGYQWDLSRYLLAFRLRTVGYRSVDAVSFSIGRAW